MRLSLVLALIALAMAGCADSDPSTGAPVEETEDGRQARVGDPNTLNATINRTFAGEFDLVLTMTESPAFQASPSDHNCIAVKLLPLTILAGNATFAWQAQGPNTETLEFALVGHDGTVLQRAEGPSPIEQAFGRLPTAPPTDFGLDGYRISIQVPGEVGVAQQQPIHLALDFVYESDHDAEIVAESCTAY